ncbi:MAG: hypothetical protein GXO08_03990 [Aquificae bacterium]|nr:hypothetical protein [Aquificota bacterium]
MRFDLRALFAALPLLAFSMGGQPEVSTVVPARLVDETGKVHEVSALVCEGRTYFVFKDGALDVKVPFEKIDRLRVLGKEGDLLQVEVVFKDGTRKVFYVSADTYCVGSTEYGSVEAYLDRLREIDFLP